MNIIIKLDRKMNKKRIEKYINERTEEHYYPVSYKRIGFGLVRYYLVVDGEDITIGNSEDLIDDVTLDNLIYQNNLR